MLGLSWPWSYGSWIYNYLCNWCLLPLISLWCCNFESSSGRGVQHYVIKVVCNLRQVGVFFPGSPFSSTNKSDCHNITEILLKVALNTINHKNQSYARQLSILTNRTTSLWVDTVLIPGNLVDSSLIGRNPDMTPQWMSLDVSALPKKK